MLNYRRLILLPVLFALVMGADAHARKMSFDEAVEIVQSKSFDAMRAQIDVLLAKTDRTKIATAISPFGTFGYGDVTNSKAQSFGGPALPIRGRSADVTLGLNMSEAAMAIIKLWAQSTQIEITNEQKELVLISTTFGVAAAYRQAQAAAKSVEVKNSRLETAKKQLKDTEALYVYGKISKSDKLAIEVDYNNAIIDATTAKNELQKSLLSLKKLLAIDDDESLELDELKDLNADAVKDIPTETQAVADALKDRVDLSIAQHAVSGTHIQKWLMLKPYVPSTIVQMDWKWNFGELAPFQQADLQVLTLNLTWNFWDGGAAIADFHKTHLQARRYTIDLREKHLGIKSEAEQAVRDLALAKETLRLRDVGLEKAQEAYRGFETRFALGAVSVTELLFAENTLNQAKLDHLSATVGIDIAYMNLQKAMGKKRPVPL